MRGQLETKEAVLRNTASESLSAKPSVNSGKVIDSGNNCKAAFPHGRWTSALPEIYPCPFCFAEPKKCELRSLVAGIYQYFHVHCNACGEDGPYSIDDRQAIDLWSRIPLQITISGTGREAASSQGECAAPYNAPNNVKREVQ